MNQSMTEKQLIEELRCGNESAFRRIYDRHYVPLCRFADLFLHDTSLSEEVVDDAIFYLWEHRSEVEITYSLRAYLMKSVRNRCLNELNSLAHREELQFSSFSLPENVEFLDTLFIEKDHPLGYLLEQELEDARNRQEEAQNEYEDAQNRVSELERQLRDENVESARQEALNGTVESLQTLYGELKDTRLYNKITELGRSTDLLEEDPNMPPEQRAARVHIALEKAYRLETMVNEFFEITKYKSQKITLSKETIDLYYMLVQLSDELSPVLAPRGNTVTLHLDEDLTIEADPEKLARVFNNILRNAASYSDPHTEIVISAEKLEHEVILRFQNSGDDIPTEALASLFDKFYRADQARSSDTGGTGLGLAIAKEIVTLHGGTISASSKNHVVTFTISVPLSN